MTYSWALSLAGSSQPALKRQTSSGARPRGRPPKLLRRERRDREDDDGEAWRPRKETQRSRSEVRKRTCCVGLPVELWRFVEATGRNDCVPGVAAHDYDLHQL